MLALLGAVAGSAEGQQQVPPNPPIGSPEPPEGNPEVGAPEPNPPVGAPEPPEEPPEEPGQPPPPPHEDWTTPVPDEPSPASPSPAEPSPATPSAQGHERAPSEPAGGASQGSLRFAFHGYARMPLSLEGTPRLPFLVDDDYALSGFSYTRLHETDWSELYLSAIYREDVEVTFGLFCSLFSDWGGIELDRQLGIAQASVLVRRLGGLEPLSVQAGMFWDRLGYLEPYDTYVFGRTHQAGARVRWDFPGGAHVQAGFGAHRAALQQNQGFTPLAHVEASVPVGPLTLGGYVLRAWTRDRRELSPIEDADLWVAGVDARWDLPAALGPLYVAAAYYGCEKCVFLAPVLELSHSEGGRGLTENYLGLEASNNGTGSMLVWALDFPARIPPLPNAEVRLFGLGAWVRSDQVDEDDPAANRDRRLYLKWGLEPSYRVLPWLRGSVRFDRVVLDFYDAENSFRVFSFKASLLPNDWSEVFLMYSRYVYGDKVHLRPGQEPLVTEPDEGVVKIQAQARW